MSKRFILIAGLLALIVAAGVMIFRKYVESDLRQDLTAKDILEARRKMGVTPPPTAATVTTIPKSRTIRLAIGSVGLPDDASNGQIADLITVHLTGEKGLELVDRQSLGKVLRETEMSLSGLVRAKDAIRVGKLVRADWFLLGTLMRANGSNSVVARVVDARTGIFLDTTVASIDKGPQHTAEELTSFVRKCRADAAAAKASIYLALGAFDDLSQNNRLAGFPADLRARLVEAYRGTPITMLERDHVDTLLQEIRLDLAGMTDTGTNSAAAMQTAFWLAEGDYQSYEVTNPGVELALRITRIFGLNTRTTIRDLQGEPIFRRVKNALDQAILQNKAAVVPTRLSEMRAQMVRGRELAPISEFFGDSYHELTEQEARLQKRRVEEAIRAFKAALLLEPTNREAKFNLAVCYCKPVIGRVEEGRRMYQEVLDEGIKDRWHDSAARWLLSSFGWSDPAEVFQWFSNAEKQTSNTNLQTFYHEQAVEAQNNMLIGGPDRSKAEILVEKRLFEFVRGCEQVLQGKSGTCGGAYGMYRYVEWFGQDNVEAGRSLARLLPRLTSVFSNLAPHLTAAALEFQLETNNPVLGELQRQLEWCRANPKKIFASNYFWNEVRYLPYNWCMQHGDYPVAVDIMEAVREAARYTNSVNFDNQDQIALAFAYKGTQQWKEALAIFECFSNLPLVMHRGDGPWGKAFQPVPTAKEVAYCKEQLGIRTSNDPREFDMGKNLLCMHSASAFATTSDGVWIAIGNRLLHLDFDMHTNFVEILPKDSWTGINCLLVGDSKIWVGTDGAGLFEFDKISRQTRRYMEKDGLMKDIVSSLCLAGDTLWIGYGVKEIPSGQYVSRLGGGGLGSLKLTDHKFHNFTPSLELGADALRNLRGSEPLNIPTRRTVSAIVVGPQTDVWFKARGSPLRRYRPTNNVWEAFREIGFEALAASPDQLFLGRFQNYMQPPKSGPLGVAILNFANEQRTELNDFGVLPAGMVSALSLDGKFLWIGGSGYIAKVDPAQNELVKFASIRSTLVDQIQIAGGFVWAQFDRHLHRAKLP